jgi:hypothetical protein
MPLVIHLDDTRYDLDDDRRAIVGRLRIILQVKEARASVREPYTGTHRALCGWALARSHARSGDAAQVAAYLGGRDGFDQAVISYAEEYPRTTRRDHVRLLEAIGAAEVTASEDPFRAAR